MCVGGGGGGDDVCIMPADLYVCANAHTLHMHIHVVCTYRIHGGATWDIACMIRTLSVASLYVLTSVSVTFVCMYTLHSMSACLSTCVMPLLIGCSQEATRISLVLSVRICISLCMNIVVGELHVLVCLVTQIDRRQA